jgi:UDP-2,3-diacylglucosamine hydrolase
MAILFISDLHLEDRRPEMTAQLLALLQGEAREAEALYILGDLFEFWIGDDVLSPTAERVADGLKTLSGTGVPCYFMHGNRDFLIGPDYAERAGLQLLPETVELDLYGDPTLLLHGDTLCTDDVAYQAFRQQVRNPAWQQAFLQQSVEERFAIARQARDASKQHTSSASMEIMDVNQQAVNDAYSTHGLRHMIHGHTHRPNFHEHTLDDGEGAYRIVLADWYRSGSFLRVSPKGAVMQQLG